MNANRVVLLAILIVTASATEKNQPTSLNSSPMNSDQVAVYRVFLDSDLKGGGQLNLAKRTVPFDLSKEQGTECLRSIRFRNPVLASVHEFDTGTLPSTITLVDSVEQDRIIRNVDSKQTWRDGKLVNESLETAQAAGYLILSEVTFDRKREYAALTFRFECWGLCGNGGTVVFQKRDGKWMPSSRSCPQFAS
jgi:hypothetical protein